MKYAVSQFCDSEATSGWQFLCLHLYDTDGTHLLLKFTEQSCVI